MNIRERIEKRFLQVGLRCLRATADESELIASAVSGAHDRLGAFCSYCLQPGALATGTSHAIVARWLATVPAMLPVADILYGKNLSPAPTTQISQETLDRLFSSTESLTVTSAASVSIDSAYFADCVVRCASPAFAFHQRCMSPEDHTLQALAGSLVSYMGVLPLAAAAHQLIQPLHVNG